MLVGCIVDIVSWSNYKYDVDDVCSVKFFMAFGKNHYYYYYPRHRTSKLCWTEIEQKESTKGAKKQNSFHFFFLENMDRFINSFYNTWDMMCAVQSLDSSKAMSSDFVFIDFHWLSIVLFFVSFGAHLIRSMDYGYRISYILQPYTVHVSLWG